MNYKYQYLISYNFRQGRGNVTVTLAYKLTNADRVTKLAKQLGKQNNLDNVIIENFILLRKVEKRRGFIK